MAGEKLQESVIAGHFERWFCINAIRFWCLWVRFQNKGFVRCGMKLACPRVKNCRVFNELSESLFFYYHCFSSRSPTIEVV